MGPPWLDDKNPQKDMPENQRSDTPLPSRRRRLFGSQDAFNDKEVIIHTFEQFLLPSIQDPVGRAVAIATVERWISPSIQDAADKEAADLNLIISKLNASAEFSRAAPHEAMEEDGALKDLTNVVRQKFVTRVDFDELRSQVKMAADELAEATEKRNEHDRQNADHLKLLDHLLRTVCW